MGKEVKIDVGYKDVLEKSLSAIQYLRIHGFSTAKVLSVPRLQRTHLRLQTIFVTSAETTLTQFRNILMTQALNTRLIPQL